MVMSDENAAACPTLVPCHEIAKRTHQVHKAGAQAEEHAAIASLNHIEDEVDAMLAAVRAKKQSEPTAAARKEHTAA